MFQKLKSFLADDALYYSVVVILVAGASFGLGRQSVVVKSQDNSPKTQSTVTVTPPPPAAGAPSLNPTTPNPIQVTDQPAAVVGSVVGEVVASKSGTKYHLPTCSGAKSIKPENLISFSSRTEAEAAGYTPAANCKGLQ